MIKFRLDFTGAVINTLAQGQPLDADSVTVSSPAIGTLCTWQKGGGGGGGGEGDGEGDGEGYACSAELSASTPLDLVYTVSGVWGMAVISDTLTDLPPAGEAATVRRDLALSPTTILLHGVVTDPDGNRLENVTVGIGGEATADVNGAYEAYVVMREGALSGTLTAYLNYGSANDAPTVEFSDLVPGQLNDISADLVFSTRRVIFRGRITSALDGQPVESETLTISIASNTVCVFAGSSYECQVDTAPVDEFVVTYTVEGSWGSVSASETVAAGAVGSTATVERDFAVTP